MSQTNIDIKSNSIFVALISFIYGGFAQRYNTSPAIIDIPTTSPLVKRYLPLPATTIDLGKQSGQAKDEPIKIVLPKVPPFDVMLDGGPHAPVIVMIEEVDPTDLTTLRYLFKGMIAKVLSGKNGRDDVIELTVNGIRAGLEIPLGVPANNTCAWTFGDFNCTKDLSGLSVSTLATAVTTDGVLTIASGANAAPYYNRGYVERNGLRIMIRNQIDANNLQLVNQPPADWIGSTVTVVPGCNKSVSDCSSKWSNIAQFGGLGLGIPRYHPVYETQ